MIDKLQSIINQYNELSDSLSDPVIISDSKKFAKIAKEHNSLSPIVEKSTVYIDKINQLKSAKEILESEDSELALLAKEEISILSDEIDKLEQELKILLIPKDPNDNNNIILEIRSGTGGDEAALFAGDLMRMYMRYVERMKWSSEIITLHDNEGGGIKEAVISVKGIGAYGNMKFESGVHRVQRVPDTESSGRLHTSAATVAVLPEIEDLDIEIKDSDIKIDTYRASGAGGQHVNKTESAIRVTHLPTGVVVTCQDESSQHKNKDKALKVLRSKIYEIQQEEQAKERADKRKSMVSTGDRSAKIRTYNFPQGRLTDHRINLTLYKLNDIMDGDLQEIFESLQLENQKLLMENA
ncbi:MAG: peptide chain release factor 1 [Candidatus Marinimicrobia bacterium]|mgnify:FL=1|nr:peptide chain release factor 1 [Candidatus Neomarinimicrobiota bacterium]|tara:strand:+ start:31816 stop:32877 length:1062 start_codon:yes stop_codon:yes gene_type:complete